MKKTTMSQASKYSTANPRALKINTSDFASHISYILIYPFFKSMQYKHKEHTKERKPMLFHLNDQKTRVHELTDKIRKKYPEDKLPEKVNIMDQNGTVFDENSTIKEVKHLLKMDNINGTIFYLCQSSEEEWNLENQCGYLQYNENFQFQQNPDKVQFNFCFEGVPTILTAEEKFRFDYDHSNQLKNMVIKEVQEVFHQDISISDIKGFSIEVDGKQMELPTQINVFRTAHLTNRSYINVNLKTKLPPLPSNNLKTITIIDQFAKNEENSFAKIEFGQIRKMTWEAVYFSYFKKQATTQDGIKCLLILDNIMKPLDKFEQFQIHFSGKSIFTVVGKVISERIKFYDSITKALKDEKPFTLSESYLVFKDQLAKSTHQERFSEVLIKTKQAEKTFSESEIELIYYYTSDVKVKENSQNNQVKIYHQLNHYLHNETIIYKSPEVIKQQWKYRYTYSMRENLQKVKDEEDTWVYRGVGYDLKKTKNDYITFKGWLSTSKSRNVAINFAISAFDNPEIEYERADLDCCLLKMKVKKGKYIKDYSFHPHEEEILVEPLTTFRVVETKLPSFEEHLVEFKQYELEEVQETGIAPSKTNFIVWISHNRQDSLKYYHNYVKYFLQTTVLVQLSDNSELSNWIMRHRKQIENKNSNIVFISNMRSENEKGIVNEYAGIEAIEIIRKNFPNRLMPICLFVAKKQTALSKMKEKKVAVEKRSLEVYELLEDVSYFAEEHLSVVNNLDGRKTYFQEDDTRHVTCGRQQLSCSIY